MKNWIVHYFRGGFLMNSPLMTKEGAKNFMEEHVDGHSMEQVSGLGKGKIINKFPKKDPFNLKRGFTLIEIMIVAIIALLASIGISGYTKSKDIEVGKYSPNNVEFISDSGVHCIWAYDYRKGGLSCNWN